MLLDGEWKYSPILNTLPNGMKILFHLSGNNSTKVSSRENKWILLKRDRPHSIKWVYSHYRPPSRLSEVISVGDGQNCITHNSRKIGPKYLHFASYASRQTSFFVYSASLIGTIDFIRFCISCFDVLSCLLLSCYLIHRYFSSQRKDFGAV